MRIDLFIKVAGLLKTRSIAGRAISSGSVLRDGKPAKASHSVTEGSIIRLIKPDGTVIEVEVLQIPSGKNVSRSGRKELYREIEGGTDCL